MKRRFMGLMSWSHMKLFFMKIL